MAFAQLTFRESLRDIEACLDAQPSKLYGMGFRNPVARSTLADANEQRDWRMWHDLAAILIRRARKLYADDDIGLDLDNTIYALDSTTIDLCLFGEQFWCAPAQGKVSRLLDMWHGQLTGETLVKGASLNLDFHSVPYFGEHPLVQSHYLPKRSRRQPSILTFLAHGRVRKSRAVVPNAFDFRAGLRAVIDAAR